MLRTGHLDLTTNAPHRSENIPRRLSDIQNRLMRAVTRHQRTPAAHNHVVMISPKDRSSKPNALPVLCVPYSGMPEVYIRDLVNKLVKVMHTRDASSWYANEPCTSIAYILMLTIECTYYRLAY